MLLCCSNLIKAIIMLCYSVLSLYSFHVYRKVFHWNCQQNGTTTLLLFLCHSTSCLLATEKILTKWIQFSDSIVDAKSLCWHFHAMFVYFVLGCFFFCHSFWSFICFEVEQFPWHVTITHQMSVALISQLLFDIVNNCGGAAVAPLAVECKRSQFGIATFQFIIR